MSHFKERKENNCLNCNAIVHDRFCGICGQENIEPKESAWHLVKHFFEDITHFDGKFFSSLKYLIFKPGFLSSEYVRGRRMAYLNPVRFYIFTSFIFFLIFFSFFFNVNTESETNTPNEENAPTPIIKIDNLKNEINQFRDSINYFDSINKTSKKDIFTLTQYSNESEYDSLKKLGQIKDGWFLTKLAKKQFEVNKKYDHNIDKMFEAFFENLKHLIPQILFLTLPFFALMLKFYYVRQKKFYYVSHLIFTLHLYIFIYINILVINCFGSLAKWSKIYYFYDITLLLGVGGIIYSLLAMKNFYCQSWGKTIIKFLLISFSLMFLIIFFSILLLSISLINL